MRSNPTQLALELASGGRAYQAELVAIRQRESIIPLERRRRHRLAALIALTPIDRRG